LDLQEPLYLFKEPTVLTSSHKPAFTALAPSLTYSTILQTLQTHKHLHLPRITSTHFFQDLCPSWQLHPSSDQPTPLKLVCILIPANSQTKQPEFLFNEHLKVKLIKKLSTDGYYQTTTRFAFIYQNIQLELFARLTKSLKLKQINNIDEYFKDKILLLKRIDGRNVHLLIDELKNNLSNKEEIKQEVDRLQDLVKSVINGQTQFGIKITFPELIDETGSGLFQLMVDYLEDMWQYVGEREFWERLLGNSSYMMIVLCTILFIWLMMMFSQEKSDPFEASRFKRFGFIFYLIIIFRKKINYFYFIFY